MQIPDLINGTFEAIGAVSAWSNFQRLKKDREVKGVVWQFTIFWFTWGLWNIYYYPFLGQWVSTFSGVVLCAGNCAWLGLLGKIYAERWKQRGNQDVQRAVIQPTGTES